jgi:hypothetical protein
MNPLSASLLIALALMAPAIAAQSQKDLCIQKFGTSKFPLNDKDTCTQCECVGGGVGCTMDACKPAPPDLGHAYQGMIVSEFEKQRAENAGAPATPTAAPGAVQTTTAPLIASPVDTPSKYAATSQHANAGTSTISAVFNFALGAVGAAAITLII